MKKTLTVILIALFALLMTITNVYATTSFTVALSASKTSIQQGDEVEVTVSLKDFTAGETGINAIGLTVDYDTAVFETLEASNITALNGWGAPTFNPANGAMALDASAFIAENHDMIKIKFKVKDAAAVGSTTITIKGVNAADGINDIYPADQKINLSVTAKQAQNNTNNNTVANNTTKNVNVNAGLEDMGTASVIVPAVILFAVVGIMAYVKYTRIDK